MSTATYREAEVAKVAESFGRSLLGLREARQLAPDELANKAGITVGMLRVFESGRAWPRVPTLILLLVALDCTLEDFGRQVGPWHFTAMETRRENDGAAG